MPASPIVLSMMLLGLAACAFALVKGGRPERIAAILILANLVVGAAGRLFTPEGASVFRLANDGLIAFAFLGVTLLYGRPWLGAVMLFYAAQFALHSVYFVTDRPNDRLHSMANNLNFLGVHLCLVIGAAVAWRQSVLRRKAN